LIFIAFYGPKFIENEKILALKCLKDVSEANLKTAGYTGQRFIECCGKSIFCLLLQECSTYLSKSIGSNPIYTFLWLYILFVQINQIN